MKQKQQSPSSLPVVIALIAVFALGVKLAGAAHSSGQQSLDANSKLQAPTALGELGRQDRYIQQKEFWGDDSISQGAKSIADNIGHGLNKLQKQ